MGVDLADSAAIPLIAPVGAAPAASVHAGQVVLIHGGAGQRWARGGAYGEEMSAQVIAGGSREATGWGPRPRRVSDVLATDDDAAIEKFRMVDAIADTVGGEVAAKLIAKVKQGGSFGYASSLPEGAAALNPGVKIARVGARSDASKVREFADDVRDGKFVLPIGRRMPLRDAAEAHMLGEKGGIGKIVLLAPDLRH